MLSKIWISKKFTKHFIKFDLNTFNENDTATWYVTNREFIWRL